MVDHPTLSTRAKNVFRLNPGFGELDENWLPDPNVVANMPLSKLRRLTGRKTLREIKEWVRSYGLELVG